MALLASIFTLGAEPPAPIPEIPVSWIDVVAQASDSLGPVVERWGLPVVLLGFALWVLYRLGMDYVRTLKEAVTRAEEATKRAEEATVRVEAERDELSDALKKYAEETNNERRDLLLDVLQVVKRLKADPDAGSPAPRDPTDPRGGG